MHPVTPQIGTAHQTFLDQQIQRAVDGRDVESACAFVQGLEYFFRSDVMVAAGEGCDDHLPLGCHTIAARPQFGFVFVLHKTARCCECLQ